LQRWKFTAVQQISSIWNFITLGPNRLFSLVSTFMSGLTATRYIIDSAGKFKEQLFVRSDSWWSVPGYNFPALSIIYLVAVKPDMKVLTNEKRLFGPSVIKFQIEEICWTAVNFHLCKTFVHMLITVALFSLHVCLLVVCGYNNADDIQIAEKNAWFYFKI
jgi:hypothetical protein